MLQDNYLFFVTLNIYQPTSIKDAILKEEQKYFYHKSFKKDISNFKNLIVLTKIDQKCNF